MSCRTTWHVVHPVQPTDLFYEYPIAKMKKTEYKESYRRTLPHYQPAGATLFLTFRLANSLPKSVVEKLEAERSLAEAEIRGNADPLLRDKMMYENQKRYFGLVDGVLDKVAHGPAWLSEPAVANLMVESIRYRDGRVYELDAFTIMPNHVHLVIRPLEDKDGRCEALSAIMMSLKRRTSREANRLLQREGAFWQHESYDHVVRDELEWQRIIRYVLENPVRAGLADHWDAWPWSYLRED